MATVVFSPNIRSHVAVDDGDVEGETVAEALQNLFALQPRLQGYLLDDRGAVRKHVAIFLDGESIGDREAQSDRLPPEGSLFIMQALSGG